jgi:hypothetical protein
MVKWLLNDEKAFPIFCRHFLKTNRPLSKASFWRVFETIKYSEENTRKYTTKQWKFINTIIDKKINFQVLPKSIKAAIPALRNEEGIKFCTNQANLSTKNNKIKSLYLKELKPNIFKKYMGKFVFFRSKSCIYKSKWVKKVGVRKIKTIPIYPLPKEYFIIQKQGNCLLLRDTQTKEIIGSWIKGDQLRGSIFLYLHSRLVEIYQGKPIVSRSEKRDSFGKMTSYGPFHPSWGKNRPKIDFYTSTIKFASILGKKIKESFMIFKVF